MVLQSSIFVSAVDNIDFFRLLYVVLQSRLLLSAADIVNSYIKCCRVVN